MYLSPDAWKSSLAIGPMSGQSPCSPCFLLLLPVTSQNSLVHLSMLSLTSKVMQLMGSLFWALLFGTGLSFAVSPDGHVGWMTLSHGKVGRWFQLAVPLSQSLRAVFLETRYVGLRRCDRKSFSSKTETSSRVRFRLYLTSGIFIYLRKTQL